MDFLVPHAAACRLCLISVISSHSAVGLVLLASGFNMFLSYRLVSVLEVCTGSKLKPEPGPYPRLSDPTRPDPSGTVKFRARTRPEIPPPPQRIANKKKRKKAAFHDCMQRNRLIKALPFHKHLPVMKVCEHQVQRSHTFCRVYEFCMDKKIILPPYKLWSFFVS